MTSGIATTFLKKTNRRENIAALIKEFNKLEQPECEVVHRFTPGCYLREIHMSANTIVLGKIHATEHFNIILSGECIVFTEGGEERIKAPHTFISSAGEQKCVVNITDVVWQTTHVTNKTDLKEIEAEVIAENYSQLDEDIKVKLFNGERL